MSTDTLHVATKPAWQFPARSIQAVPAEEAWFETPYGDFADLHHKEQFCRLLATVALSREQAGLGDTGFDARQIGLMHGAGPDGEELAYSYLRDAKKVPGCKIYGVSYQAATQGLRFVDGNPSHSNLKFGPPYPRLALPWQARPIEVADRLIKDRRPFGSVITQEIHSAHMETDSMVWCNQMSLSLLGTLAMLSPGKDGKKRRNVILLPRHNPIGMQATEIEEKVALLDIGMDCPLTRPGEATRLLRETMHEMSLDDLETVFSQDFDVYGYVGSRPAGLCNDLDLDGPHNSLTYVGREESIALGLPPDAMWLNCWPSNPTREFVIPIAVRGQKIAYNVRLR